MSDKKISDMTTDELVAHMLGELETLESHTRELDEYYKEKISRYQALLQRGDNSLGDLRRYASELHGACELVAWSKDKQTMADTLWQNLKKKPRRGEIWTCELGRNIGSEENKVRPVIIVQNNTGNERAPTTIVVPISNRQKRIAVHVVLKASDYVLMDKEAEPVTGTILCEQIKVVSKARLGRHVATLNKDFMVRVLDRRLKESLDL